MHTSRLIRTSVAVAFVGTQLIAMSVLAQTADSASRGPASTAAEPANAMKAANRTASVTPQTFATQAATTDLAEIELAQLAIKNSSDPAIKKFAEQMVKDHTASSAKLKTIAAKDNLTLPTTLDAEHAAVKNKLAALKGEQFDQAYGKEMAKGHDKAVALFESASQAPQVTGDLKQFAASNLSTIRGHKELAHDLHDKEGG